MSNKLTEEFTKLTDGFEPGQIYTTLSGEVWCVTEVKPLLSRIDILILFSPVQPLCGRHSWYFVTRQNNPGLKLLAG